MTAANSQTFGYSAANRLNAASGVYGSKSWTYDGVGNRTGETTVSGGTTIDTYTLSATSNRLTQVTRAGATVRAFTYDGAGNILTDNRSGATTTYTYNKRNRLAFLLGAATLLAESRPPRH